MWMCKMGDQYSYLAFRVCNVDIMWIGWVMEGVDEG